MLKDKEKKETFEVIKSFTLDKFYHVGQAIELTKKELIKELLTNKYIK